MAVDEDSVFPELNLVREAKMGGVILDEVLEVFGIHEGIIDCRDRESPWVFEGSPQHEPTNPAQSIDANHI